ncbi:hypothetical protein [Agrococcus carbonis]|uniref:Uncharacterized protein n=1 Tax=Agrococcus carbonis TaxID=684552 RepID=A0A1H1S1P2_9MICO|nr:hypothetical protein [Agrococcus carbonis]SDS41895.1 hypothetical protein SAMN04489719_2276 [Agrococcus carbonis]
MSDDELRRRLQEVPGPGARLDADAIVASAKRRRRPKTIALSSAATAAAVLIVAPFVTPGLSPLRPASEVGSPMDAAAPESDAGADGSGEESAGGATEPGDAGATEAGEAPAASDTDLAAACRYPSLLAETGIRATFADDPGDGRVDIAFELPASGGEVVVLGVAIAHVAADGAIVSAPEVAAFDDSGTRSQASGAGGLVRLGTFVLDDAPPVDCGVGGESSEAPLLLVELDGQARGVVGEPGGVR